jgi:DNA polymerase-3 subunit alpha
MRFGTFSEKTLLKMAASAGVESLALTDINNTSACLNFIRLSAIHGIRPIVGIDFRNGADQLYIGLARNNEGFMALNHYLSTYTHAKESLPAIAVELPHTAIIYPFEKAVRLQKKDFLPNEYIGIRPEQLSRLAFSCVNQYRDQHVILQTVTFRGKRDFNAHRLLRAIDNNTLLSKLPSSEQAQLSEVMYKKEKLLEIYKDYPHIIANTHQLMESCSIQFDFSADRAPQNQQTYSGSEENDEQLIRQLCTEGLKYRYGAHPGDEVISRLGKELRIIRDMRFVSYFLINWDIVRYARHKGYFYVGRGSGANSIIAYLLRITDVDPIELDLYFERFINMYRTSPPDFDIDFSWRDREDVTRYIFERFDHTALLATYNTFQYRAAVRELGKVFGLPKHEIDILSDGAFRPSEIDHIARLVLRYARLIQGMPNHLSVHSAGILISEKPIHYFSATDLPPKGFPTTQFDMVVAEDVGLYKFDILGQRGLAKIKETLYIIKQNQPYSQPFDIHDVKQFKQDAQINAQVKRAQCMGCFYVESPAMRMLLQKLEVDNYLGLVAASSIIRPGVARSGMMREYILRHRHPERIKEAHPVMLDIMPETYGIMVYQEDVIKVAHYFAGLTLGEADVLRRGMSGKYRSRDEFKKVQDKFFRNCRDKNYPEHTIAEIWRQIESFAGYAFAKGHSASYAVESYQTLFLRTYYPLEYMVAILNNGGGFYRPEIYVHEARMLGATIHAPCINRSNYETVIYGTDIYLGMVFLKGLESELAYAIVDERRRHGPFKDFQDFMERVPISLEQVSILIRIAAFRFSGINKRKLLWQAHLYVNRSSNTHLQANLFRPQINQYKIPELSSSKLEDAYDQIELLGFSLSSPFYLLETAIRRGMRARYLEKRLEKIVTILGYSVTVKKTTTIKRQRMNFGTFIDQDGDVFDTTHFPNVAARYPFRGKGIYSVTGKVVKEFGFYSIEVSKMEKLANIPDPRYAEESEKTVKN